MTRPRRAKKARTPRRRPEEPDVLPPGMKLLSGEVTTRSDGTHVYCPPVMQSPYWTVYAPLGSCVASVMRRPWNEPPSQYTGQGATIMLSSELCGTGRS